MALFTEAPARRLAYHLDGSQVSYWKDDNVKYIVSQSELPNINDIEATVDQINMASASTTKITINFLFPEKRDIFNYFMYFYNGSPKTLTVSEISVSVDTTDGYNGTWTPLTVPSPMGLLKYSESVARKLDTKEWFDSSYVSGTLVGATGIVGIMFTIIPSSVEANIYLKTLNLWGKIADPSVTQRVAFTDNIGNPLTKDNPPFTVKRNDTNIQSMYLKNLHSTATSQIVFSVDGEITTVNNAVTISVDGGATYNALPYTWATSLGAGVVSSEIKVKYIVPATETYGLKYYGINAKPTFV